MSWKPIGSIYDVVRKQWFGPGHVFADGDWLPRLYSREFEHTTEPANVPEQSSIPTPPPPTGGGPDPRVDQLVADVAALKATPPGSGQDPRVDGLIGRVTDVETKAEQNSTKAGNAAQAAADAVTKAIAAKQAADDATTAAGSATQAATTAITQAAAATRKAEAVEGQIGQANAKATSAEQKAIQAASAASEAGNKAEQAAMNAIAASQTAQNLQTKVDAADAAASRAEQKAGEAESKAIGATTTAKGAADAVAKVKPVTDKLTQLDVAGTYQGLQTKVMLAKQGADNAEIIAMGVNNTLSEVKTTVEQHTQRIDDLAQTNAAAPLRVIQTLTIQPGRLVQASDIPDGLLAAYHKDGNTNKTIAFGATGPSDGYLATFSTRPSFLLKDSNEWFILFLRTRAEGAVYNRSDAVIYIDVFGN